MSYSEKRKQIDLLQQKINSYGELSPDVKKKINYKFRLDWNYYSNSMEGNTLTKEETRSVMVGNITVEGKPISDVMEMRGHDNIISEIIKIGKGEIRLSEKRIKDIHKGIMHEEDETKKDKIGKWKTKSNYIINYKGEHFDFLPPSEVPEKIHTLLDKTNAAIDAINNNKKNAPHPLDVALQFHLDYVLIHPFYDGNGRTARILTNLLLISFGYPPFWVKTDERNAYNQYIADIQGHGGKSDLFFNYVSDLIIRSQQLVLDAIAGNEIEDPDDLDKELALLKAELKGENILSVEANSENICDAIENNIIPIYNIIEEKCATIKEFFFETHRRIEVAVEHTQNLTFVDLDKMSLEEIKTDWLKNKVRDNGIKINKLRYNYILKGFKKDISGRSFWFDIEVIFDEYNYTIQTIKNRNNPPQLPYGRKLSDSELLTFVKPLIKEVIDSIKQLNKK